MKKFEVTEQTTREELVAALSQCETTIADLEQKLEDARAAFDAAEETVEDLKQKLDEANGKVAAITKTITHKGVKYVIAIPKFRIGDRKYTSADLEKNAELVEELIAMKSGVIVKLEDREDKKKK